MQREVFEISAPTAQAEASPPPADLAPETIRPAVEERARTSEPSHIAVRVRRFAAPPVGQRRRAGASPLLVEPPSFRPTAEPPGQFQPLAATVPPPPSVTTPALPPVARAVQFEPPVLSNQRVPVAIPPDLRRLLRTEVVLQLKVSVDQRGDVTQVVPVGALGKAEEALAKAYTSAVKSWNFEPARRNGTPSTGDTTLTFRISPGR
jgi:hypothetical protein